LLAQILIYLSYLIGDRNNNDVQSRYVDLGEIQMHAYGQLDHEFERIQLRAIGVRISALPETT
jgi:hypothetical protein